MPDGSRHVDVGEVLVPDAVGRQVDDARRDGRDAEQPAQVAELERAVDQADAVLLAERDGQVVGERRAADAALRAEQRHDQGAGARRLERARLPDLADQRRQVEAGERHLQHGVDAALGVLADRVLRDGEHDDRRPAARAWRICWATCWPLTRPWSSASTITTSGCISPTLATARSPAVTTSSILICDWAPEQRPDVGRDLRDVLHHQEPDLFACHHSPQGPNRSRASQHDDAPLAPFVERVQVMGPEGRFDLPAPPRSPGRSTQQVMDTRAGSRPEAELSYHRARSRP